LIERLPITFASVDDYADGWARHPAFQHAWTDDVDAYARYDVHGESGSFRCVVSEQAVLTDLREMLFDDATRTALDQVRAPIYIVRAARGLRDEEDAPAIAAAALDAFAAERPEASIERVSDANHYTVMLGAGHGPHIVVGAIERALRQASDVRARR
jgi:hypothetical protein